MVAHIPRSGYIPQPRVVAQPRTLGYQSDSIVYAEGVIQWHGAAGTPRRRAIVKPLRGMGEVGDA